MWMSRQRNEAARLLGKRLLLLGLLAVIAGLGSGVWSTRQKEHESATLKAQAQAQLADLQHRQQQLNSDIGKLQTKEGLEAALRQQYALAAEGEQLIVIVDKPEASTSIPTTTAPTFWQRLFSWL
jgi:cell division protein FtsB